MTYADDEYIGQISYVPRVTPCLHGGVTLAARGASHGARTGRPVRGTGRRTEPARARPAWHTDASIAPPPVTFRRSRARRIGLDRFDRGRFDTLGHAWWRFVRSPRAGIPVPAADQSNRLGGEPLPPPLCPPASPTLPPRPFPPLRPPPAPGPWPPPPLPHDPGPPTLPPATPPPLPAPFPPTPLPRPLPLDPPPPRLPQSLSLPRPSTHLPSLPGSSLVRPFALFQRARSSGERIGRRPIPGSRVQPS